LALPQDKSAQFSGPEGYILLLLAEEVRDHADWDTELDE
jgi:hypothetical protein